MATNTAPVESSPFLSKVLALFHILEIIVGFALGAAAGYVLYKDTENIVGFIVIGIAVFFLLVGIFGLCARKLFLLIGALHLVMQAVFIILIAAFYDKFVTSVEKIDGGSEKPVQDGLGYLDRFQLWICLGVGANMLVEICVMLFTAYIIRKDRELAARRRRYSPNGVV